MITLAILNGLIQCVNWILLNLFSGLSTFLSNLGSNVSILQVPSTIYDFISVCAFFLPMGTILDLFLITLGLIVGGLILAFLHFLVHVLGIV